MASIVGGVRMGRRDKEGRSCHALREAAAEAGRPQEIGASKGWQYRDIERASSRRFLTCISFKDPGALENCHVEKFKRSARKLRNIARDNKRHLRQALRPLGPGGSGAFRHCRLVNHSIIAGNCWSKQRPTPPPTLAAHYSAAPPQSGDPAAAGRAGAACLFKSPPSSSSVTSRSRNLSSPQTYSATTSDSRDPSRSPFPSTESINTLSARQENTVTMQIFVKTRKSPTSSPPAAVAREP